MQRYVASAAAASYPSTFSLRLDLLTFPLSDDLASQARSWVMGSVRRKGRGAFMQNTCHAQSLCRSSLLQEPSTLQELAGCGRGGRTLSGAHGLARAGRR